MTKPSKKKPPPRPDHPYLLLGLVALLTVVCFLPITEYFFLQDDFIILERSGFEPNAYLATMFGPEPGLFRPLTKVFYFAFMYRLFGLNPFPYHLVSLLLHIANIILVYSLLRKFKIGKTPALVTTSIFAMHVTFLDVVAWISCVQQLTALFFTLLGLRLGIRALETKSLKFVLSAIVVYALALMSMEQAYALPLILFVYAYAESKTKSRKTRIVESLKNTAPYLTILAAYMLFMLGWKGRPEEGPYVFHFGANVVNNLLTYLDWIYDVSVVMPFILNALSPGLKVSHLLILLLIVYNLARGRSRLVGFSLAYYFLTILPTLFLEKHTFYLHNYIPAFGMLLLLAPAIQDFHGLLKGWSPKWGRLFAPVLVGLVAIMCFTKVRFNETNYIRTDFALPKNFVLRRATIAKNTHDDMMRKARTLDRKNHVFMVFTDQSSWYQRNVTAALGQGSAIRLFYSSPELTVSFHGINDTLRAYDPAESEVIFFDYMGRCFTADEIRGRGGSPLKMLEPQ